MQLVAYGAQDIYLTGNPQITFFKVVYRRHTNFSMEAIEQTFNGSAVAGQRATATISRNGDLVHKLYLEMPFTVETTSADDVGSGSPATNTNVYAGINPGHTQINNIECEIGGQLIDRQYGHWMEAWAELTEKNSSGLLGLFASQATTGGADPPAVEEFTGTKFQNLAKAGGSAVSTGQSNSATTRPTASVSASVPLQFWFCRNPGLALPLIALQYHEVKIIVNFAAALTGCALGSDVKLYADYIYLDTDERRRFAQVSHEYLIEQVQYQSVSNSNVGDITLNFNHPVKELVWAGATDSTTGVRNTFNNGASTNVLLKLNGHDRFSGRPMTYFTQTQVWQHHTGTPVTCSSPSSDGFSAGAGKASIDEIGVYSFALKPEEHQPSGTCNFSRIDNAQLKNITMDSGDLNVYAVNYNVLRIMSGMGGLAYSN